ncbi:chitobiase/beta-hexosaminidase C-terminal domain-containing protein [uncultured Methanosphaera sp.]|uniref:chitobiase/beta-hexosaminidase C-terminal domain-containing protein n=1 Tax=uncultured Methanosphaera sp. TaxID=262501 RepID=UPI000DC53EAE|nr:chitobiase/beta-hexosaminidase C-terminal domain-containing protein [uncultured Methanosphaera sp.]RAP45703.1 MAG: hypothetical protein BZ134_00635 [Methanosphaera sp. SHI1033]
MSNVSASDIHNSSNIEDDIATHNNIDNNIISYDNLDNYMDKESDNNNNNNNENYIQSKEYNEDKDDPVYTSSSSNTRNTSYSHNGILKSCNQTIRYIKSNHTLPATILIDNKRVNMNDYLYLLCKSLNSKSSIKCNQYSHVTSSCGTNSDKTIISKNEYLTLSNEIIKCYETNKRNPKKIRTITNKTMNFDDAVYFYTKLVFWKYTHNETLPTSETVNALYNYDYSTEENALITNTTTPFTINTTLKQISTGKYNLTLKASENCTIYYTTDGTTPTNNCKKYMSSLTIYNNTLIKYYGINKNKQKTPILTYGIYQPSTPYITNKPQLEQNGYENKVNIATSQKSTIYYTINGTLPTTQSTKYTQPIKINNNTILQYFTITEKGKKSSIYYYKLQNPTPYITIINNTEVRDNHQSIIIIGNKPGIIHYTRNGTLPTAQSNQYTHGTQMNISIKTQVRTILIDKNNKQSEINFYQAPQIITPPITVIKPKTMLVNNTQTIEFTTNMANSTIYYTTDNSNPQNSKTRKTVLTGAQIKINKYTELEYYTDNDGYQSTIYTYKPPQNNNQRPTITVYNTTRMYSNGQQRIMLQSNQPGVIHYTIQTKTGTPITREYSKEITINKNQIIQIYSENTKKSKMIEYTIQNKTQSIMNYTYKITTSNTYPSHHIEVTLSNTIYTIEPDYVALTPITRNIYINTKDNTINQYYDNNIIKQPGILISIGRRLNITYYDILHGETNKVNIVYSSPTNGKEDITVFTNYKRLVTITIVPHEKQNETITTEFKTNNNKITKQETLTYTPQEIATHCGQYDLLQTYIITNSIITSKILNTTINEIDNLYNDNVANYILRITPQDRTIMEGVTFLTMAHSYSDYVAKKLNTTRMMTDEVICMTGIENNRMNYIHYNDPLLGMTITSTNMTKTKIFNMYQSMYSYQFAKFVLNTVQYNIASTTIDEMIGLIKTNSEVLSLLNNETGELEMQSTTTKNVSIILDLKTGIITSILCVNGFNYTGAITENITEDTENNTNQNIQKLPVKYCFEDGLCFNFKDKTRNFFNIPLDSGWTDVEDMIGGILIDFGTPLLITGLATGGTGTGIGLIMIGVGALLCADANGWTTDMTSINRCFDTGVSIGLSFIPSMLLSKTSLGVFRVATKNKEIFEHAGRIGKTAEVTLKGFDEAQNTLYQEARDKIVSKALHDNMLPYLNGTKPIGGWT